MFRVANWHSGSTLFFSLFFDFLFLSLLACISLSLSLSLLPNRSSPHLPRNTTAFYHFWRVLERRQNQIKVAKLMCSGRLALTWFPLALLLCFPSPSLRSKTSTCSLAVRGFKRWEVKQGLQNGKEDMSWTSLYYSYTVGGGRLDDLVTSTIHLCTCGV